MLWGSGAKSNSLWIGPQIYYGVGRGGAIDAPSFLPIRIHRFFQPAINRENPALTSINSGDYRESHRNPSKPAEYDPQFFENGTTLNLFWEIERRIIADTIRTMNPAPSRALDFACGTGRILSILATSIRETVGVDVSAPMLAVALERSPKSVLVEADITTDAAAVDGPFDVITAFRFFLNAQEGLRIESLRALRRLMHNDGLLITNFHLNPMSLTGLYLRAMRRLRGIEDPQEMMSLSDAQKLLFTNGFQTIAVHGYGYFLHRTRRLAFPFLLRPFEKRLAAWNVTPKFAQNFILISRPIRASNL
jgi:ubiquinone/menaquinone biosynthesis C-methylase UbiE